MTPKITLDDQSLELLSREGELRVEDSHGVPLVVMTVDARRDLHKIVYDDSDWTEQEMLAIAAQQLDDPEGWVRPEWKSTTGCTETSPPTMARISRGDVAIAKVPQPPVPRWSPSAWLATGFGLGLVTLSPGTVGTAVEGLPLAWAISLLPGVGWQIAVIAMLFAAGIPLATAAGWAMGGAKDNQAIIWDEIVTMPVVFLLVPLTSWKIAMAGFLLHRLFDITKPPPCAQLERLPDGLGVMADDLMAAIYACVSLYGLAWVCGHFGWPLLTVG